MMWRLGCPRQSGFSAHCLNSWTKYMELEAVGAGEEICGGGRRWGSTGGWRPVHGSAADEAEKAPGAGIDPAVLRAGIPTGQAILAAKAAEKGPVQSACGAVTLEQASGAANFAAGGVPRDEERIIVSPGLTGSSRVFWLWLDSSGPSWYLGPVEGRDIGVYNTVTVGDLRAGRPDLAELLRLPVGFMAVVGANGIEAIFDPKNEIVLKPN